MRVEQSRFDASICRLYISVLLLLCVLYLFACAPRSITKPRSEIVQDAHDRGSAVASIEEDRKRFFEREELQTKRVFALISKRAKGSLRTPNYSLGPQDEVEVNVFDVPELNVTVRVRDSGFVSLPLVGAVRATGLTEKELQSNLAKRLEEYVKEPQVSVFISHYGSQKVAVMGAVQEPGSYSLEKGSNSVLELISQAGGVTDKAGNYFNFIPVELSGLGAKSAVEARAQFALNSYKKSLNSSGLEIYLEDVLGTGGRIPLEIPVRGGDMIVIPEAGRVMVEGEVENRGAHELGQRMTLLGALAAAGGIRYSAKVDEVELVRDLPNNRKGRLVVNLEQILSGEETDVRLRNGDLVRVPSHSGRRLTSDTFEGISRLINIGVGGTVNLAN